MEKVVIAYDPFMDCFTSILSTIIKWIVYIYMKLHSVIGSVVYHGWYFDKDVFILALFCFSKPNSASLVKMPV